MIVKSPLFYLCASVVNFRNLAWVAGIARIRRAENEKNTFEFEAQVQAVVVYA